MDILGSIANGAVGGLLGGIGTLAKDIRQAITGDLPAEKQAEIQQKIMDLELAVTNAQMEMIKAEASSADPWTSRARPSFLYVFYLVILLLLGSAIIGIWWPDRMEIFFVNVGKAFTAIPEPMWWTFSAGYLGYTGARTMEKKAGVVK